MCILIMHSLQPKRKSFGFYVRYDYVLSGGKPSSKHDVLFNKISLIDDSVLIMDDIFDNSVLRNGKPCVHRQHGVQYASVIAQKYQTQAHNYLVALMILSNTKPNFQLRILKKFTEFIEQVNTGQRWI